VELIENFLNQFNSLTQLEGFILYTFGAFCSSVVKYTYRKEWVDGMKGANGLWESPEIMLTILLLIIDHIFMADAFLQMHMSVNAWIAIGILFLYGFTGKWGLEWVAAWRNGKTPDK
jgi:hypothetical protein